MTNFSKYDLVVVKFPFALLKPSIFKASIATIEKDFVIGKLGTLLENDINRLEKLIKVIC
mgnify:CR=1 FL=1